MRSDRLAVVIFALCAFGCAAQKQIAPDTSLWTPPGQGDLEIADNHQEPSAKPKPRPRTIERPNQSTASSDNLRERNAKH